MRTGHFSNSFVTGRMFVKFTYWESIRLISSIFYMSISHRYFWSITSCCIAVPFVWRISSIMPLIKFIIDISPSSSSISSFPPLSFRSWKQNCRKLGCRSSSSSVWFVLTALPYAKPLFWIERCVSLCFFALNRLASY